ncbi:response regulator transcription factor [Halobacillus sp. Marseille-Q1614]|uniref:response regulator transcription factor n=1 Tax=Halobacillus sp. Marseille-Q1614 TaxID=2709134 RepID=UPI00156D54BB|nr:response regulator transcription factor [Halobacillus sp. Marseille-Q1614]
MSSLYGVLVVDDEMLIRQGIINYINWEEEGFQIVGEASNGREALQLIEELQPHIIMTDVVMPDVDGIELVKQVKKKYPSIEIIVLSSFENFDYVRSTFQSGVADYILKPQLNGEELIKTLRKIVPAPSLSDKRKPSEVAIEEVLQKCVHGYALTSEEERLMEGLPYEQYCLAALFHKKREALTYAAVSEQLSQQFGSFKSWLIPLNVSGTEVVLYNFEADQLPSIKQSLAQLNEQYRQSSTSMVMSVPFQTIDEIKSVYENNLLKMIDYLFYLTEEPVLFYDSLPEVIEYKPFNLSQFIEIFKQKKFDVAIHSLEEHIELLTHNYTKDIFEFKSWLENIIFNVIVLLGNMKYDVEDLETAKYEYFTDINEAQEAGQAVSRFKDFLESVQKIIKVHDNKNDSPNIQHLLQYIEDHYTEPLSLTTLAEHFHFNPSYLSSYFSSHLHIGFSDYLNQVRIEKAKHILASSSASVSQVSEMVGYGEPSYFCKVFKRIEGLSPGRYRKKSSSMI